MSRELPIGVFDSGVGGLTVLRALEATLPDEAFVYLGDTARVPYGTRSADVVARYSLRVAGFLAERGIKLLVVACNTASAVALPALSQALPLPVVGVIEPVVAEAGRRFPRGRIGVIGTSGTIASGAYQQALRRLAPQARFIAQPCPLFVPLAEEPGWAGGQVAELVAARYLQPLRDDGLDALILGCTHYPLLRDSIAQVVGPGVALLDSGEATAKAVAQLLDQRGLRAPAGGNQPSGTRRFWLTDLPAGFAEVGRRFLGRALESVAHIDI